MVPLSVPFFEGAGVKSAPNRSVMEVIVVSAHSPTLAGKIEMRSVPGNSSTGAGSGGGLKSWAEMLAIDSCVRSTTAERSGGEFEAKKLGCVHAAAISKGSKPIPEKRRKFDCLCIDAKPISQSGMRRPSR